MLTHKIRWVELNNCLCVCVCVIRGDRNNNLKDDQPMLPSRNKTESGHQKAQNRMFNDNLFLAGQMKEMIVSVLLWRPGGRWETDVIVMVDCCVFQKPKGA